MQTNVAALTHRGLVREHNEDAFWLPGYNWPPPELLLEKGYLYIVADGMGGHKRGDIASQMAVRLIARNYYQSTDVDVATALIRAIEAANKEIYEYAQQNELEGMGTTVVASVIKGQKLFVANIGDSRAYLLRGNKLHKLTVDHSWVAERVASGLLSPEEAIHHPNRHIITRSLGDKPSVQVDINAFEFLPGDRLLLCTDGLWEMLSDGEISHYLMKGNSAKSIAKNLVWQANYKGGEDNITALVVVNEPFIAPEEKLKEIAYNFVQKLKDPDLRSSLMISLGIGLIIGLLIGLIIGWGLWPVEWKNAWPVHLHRQYQARYLNLLAYAYENNENIDLKGYLGQCSERNAQQWSREELQRAFNEACKLSGEFGGLKQKERLRNLINALRPLGLDLEIPSNCRVE